MTETIQKPCTICENTTTDGFTLCGNCLMVEHLNEYLKENNIDLKSKALKNGFIGKVDDVVIYKPGEGILNDQRPI